MNTPTINNLIKLTMKTGIVAQNYELFKGYPDVICFKNHLFVVHNEALAHASYGKTSIIISASKLKPNEPSLDEPSSDDFEMQKYGDFDFKDIDTIFKGTSGRWNCPRFSIIENKLWVFCDYIDQKYPTDFGNNENNPNRTRVYMVSSSDGFVWSQPIVTNLKGILPSKIIHYGTDYYIATHLRDLRPRGYKLWRSNMAHQFIWKTKNVSSGRWVLDKTIKKRKLNLCEGHLFLYGDHLACMMRENSGLGLPAYYAVRDFHKKRWSKVKETRFYGCHRPTIDKLMSENYLITYREQVSAYSDKTWASNTIACLTQGGDFNTFRKFPINYDTAIIPDGGYTGWVQLDDRSLVIVNYITGDAPEPYIIWHHLTEHDI